MYKKLGMLITGLLLFAISWAYAVAESMFNVKGYRVDGPAYFSTEQLEEIFSPYIGEDKSLSDMQAAQQALSAAYLKNGFGVVKVTLPPQESKDGYITLKVVPVKVGKVSIKGNEYHDEFNILNSLPALKEGEIMQPVLLARQTRLSNENPAKEASIVLTAAQDDSVDAEVTIDDKRSWRAFTTYDNTGTQETGPSRVSVGFQHANLFNLDHVLTAQYTTSPNDYGGVRIWGLGYQIPIYSWAHDINFYMAHSDVDSGTISNLLNVSSKGDVYGVRYQFNFANRGFYKDKLSFGLEYRKVEPNVSIFGIKLTQPVDLHPFSVGYTASYTNPGKLDSNFYISVVSNIAGGSHGNDEDFNANRFGADADYKLLRAGGSLSAALPKGWYTKISASGQYSEDMLVSAEQFGIGGADSIRGFEEYEVRNDRGLQGSVELYTPDFFANLASTGLSARGLIFYDNGTVWRNDALPGEQTSESIASIGYGMRMGFKQNISLKLDYARVLNGSSFTDKGTEQLHALLVFVY